MSGLWYCWQKNYVSITFGRQIAAPTEDFPVEPVSYTHLDGHRLGAVHFVDGEDNITLYGVWEVNIKNEV